MLRVVLVAFVAVASAITPGRADGCPEFKPVENFNVSAYQGVWYEISKFPNESEKDGKCGQAEYTLDGDVIKVKNTHIVNGVQTFIEGTAKFAPDANNSGKLLVTLKFGDVLRETPLLALATDYNNYSIVYTCKADEQAKTHTDYAWILSRTKTLEGDAKTAVDTFLKNNEKELDASRFQQTDFSEEACKFTSSSVITEPPKA